MENLLITILLTSIPILLAGLGELVTEKSGVLNLGVEGMMLCGAVAALGSVLIFGIMKWLFKYLKLCYLHINWKIKILIIFPLSALIIIPWFLFQTLIFKGYVELIMAIILGSIGSHYIFGDEEKNEI